MSQQINGIELIEEERGITSDEYFTPPDLIRKHLFDLDPNKDYIDNNAGIGNWLVELLGWKISNGIPREVALTQLYGVELNLDTCKIMVERLWGEVTVLKGNHIPNHMRAPGLVAVFAKQGEIIQQIVCADCLSYNYTFGELETFGPNDVFWFQENT